MGINNIVTVITGAVIAAFAFLMYKFLFTRERVGATIGEEE